MCGENKPDLSSGAFIPNLLAYTVCANGSVFGHLGIDQAILAPNTVPATPHSRKLDSSLVSWVVTVWVGILKTTFWAAVSLALNLWAPRSNRVGFSHSTAGL